MATQAAEHTPGPWKWSKYYDEENAERYRAAGIEQTRCLGNNGEAFVTIDGGRIAVVDMQREGVKKKEASQADDPERDANARLIAAAPDMLAALESATKDMHLWISGGSDGSTLVRLTTAVRCLRDDLLAALAKAEPEGN